MKFRCLILAGLGFALGSATCFPDRASAAATNANPDCVVLLHGLMRTAKTMKRLEHALGDAGYRVVNVSYPSTELSIEQSAAVALRDILAEHVPPSTGKVHFVTHSLGGIVLREYLTHHALTNLGRVVMLAPPNHGSELVDVLRGLPFYELITGPAGQQLGTEDDSVPRRLGPVRCELGVIAGDRTLNPFNSLILPGPDDGKVSVASTRLEGMRDFLIVHSSHSYLPKRRKVIEAVLEFIDTGWFSKDGKPPTAPAAATDANLPLPPVAASSRS